MFKNLINHDIKDHDCIYSVLKDYFPEYEIVFTSDPENMVTNTNGSNILS